MNLKLKQFKKDLINLIIFTILFSFLILPLWLNKKFGFIYFEQFKFNLILLFNGFLDGDSNLINSAVKWLVIIPVIFSFIFIGLKKLISFFVIHKENSLDLIGNKLKLIKKNYYNSNIDLIVNIFDLIFNKLSFIIILVITAILFYLFTSFFQKPSNVSNINYLDLNYEYPDIYSEENNSNLVLLYVESLENTFSNQYRFNEDLIKEISEITEGKSIKYFYQIPGLGYTLSSLIATQCGIPLLQISKSYIETKDLKAINKFLPNIKCLTDILSEYDYENIFLSSDYLENSLTDKFLLTHNYTNMYGLEELIEMGYKTSKKAFHNKKKWTGGIHDNILLDASIELLKKKQNSKNKFFMTIMTLDTHSPNGTPNPECLKNVLELKNLNNYTFKDSFKCTSLYVSNFVNEFNKLNLKDTKLIIIGDHLFMKDLEVKERYIFNKFFIGNDLIFKRDYMNFFDFYPSILEVMNFKIYNENGKVALGYSIFKENLNYEPINFTLKGSSNLYDTFWKLDKK